MNIEDIVSEAEYWAIDPGGFLNNEQERKHTLRQMIEEYVAEKSVDSSVKNRFVLEFVDPSSQKKGLLTGGFVDPISQLGEPGALYYVGVDDCYKNFSEESEPKSTFTVYRQPTQPNKSPAEGFPVAVYLNRDSQEEFRKMLKTAMDYYPTSQILPEKFDFVDWLKEKGFKLAKMYNPHRYDYDMYIREERVVVSFSIKNKAGELRLDIGGTSEEFGSSFGLVQPKSEQEALWLFAMHNIELV